jgi:hypothetical protein
MPAKHERYFAFCKAGWGMGATEDAAIDAMPLPRYNKPINLKIRIVRCFSNKLPFAPSDRDAEPGECDAWVNGNNVVAIDCETEDLD